MNDDRDEGTAAESVEAGADAAGLFSAYRSSPCWYAVQTKPRKEAAVLEALGRAGIEVYFPRLQRPHDRGASSAWKEVPLFPGYLFTRFDFARDYPRVRWTAGLVRVVMSGGVPLPVSDATLSTVRQMEREGLRLLLRPVRWRPGARIRVVRGPFTGFEGRVAATLKGGSRIRILLELFRRQAQVECDPALLQSLGAVASR